MRRRIILSAVSTGLVATALAGSAGSAEGAKCKAGVHKFGSVQARTFCGPGSATATVGGKTFAFKGGNCVKTKKYLTINLGTIVLGQTSKKRPEYFGITVGKTPLGGTPAPKDGTYSGDAVAFVHLNKGYGVGGSSVTLTNGRTRGTFTGKTFSGQIPVSGSFRCK